MAAAFTGDGATSEGDFHEAVNLAAVWRLPVLFVIENNQYGLSTPVSEQYACSELADRGPRLRHPGRGGGRQRPPGGPPRRGAGGGAGAAGRGADAPRVQDLPHARDTRRPRAPPTCPRAALGGVGGKDPMARFESPADGEAASSRPRPRAVRALKARIDELVEEALAAPEPRLDRGARAGRRLRPSLLGPGARRRSRMAAAPEMRYVDAISDGLRDAMRRRPAGGPPRPGHRGVRRGLQGHRGLRRGVRQGPRAQHADHRVGGDRVRAGPGPRRLRAHGGDAVRGLHHLRLQPGRQQPGQDALPLGRARCRWWCASPWAAAWGPGRSTPRTWRRGSRTWPA